MNQNQFQEEFMKPYSQSDSSFSSIDDNKKLSSVQVLEYKLQESIDENMQRGIQRLRAKDLYLELVKNKDEKSLKEANQLDRYFLISDESYECEIRRLIDNEIALYAGKTRDKITRLDRFQHKLSRNKNLEFIVYNGVSSSIVLTSLSIFISIRL